MRNFDFEDQDESSQQEVETFFDEKDDQDRYLDMMQAGMDAKYITQRNLALAIQILEKSFFWRFRSNQSKLEKIQEMVEYLNNLIE